MLMEQVLVELERQEARRVKAQQRVTELESNPAADPAELLESRATFLTTTERHLLFDSQRQVLEGKQRVLARYLQRLVEVDTSLAALPWMGMPRPPAAGPQQPSPPVSATSPVASEVILQLRSQEDLRREDACGRLDDGPAQSLANIALQAEIVERLVIRGDRRAHDELESLRQMVQQALDTTKEFIFEVRPMVLDDLGLVPTLRRAAMDRSRRAGLPVDFDFAGQRATTPARPRDRRLPQHRRSGGRLMPRFARRPSWSASTGRTRSWWPPSRAPGRGPPGSSPVGRSLPALERTGETPPALLAMMEEKRTGADGSHRGPVAPPERMAEIAQRARTLGMALSVRDDGPGGRAGGSLPALTARRAPSRPGGVGRGVRRLP